MCSTEPVGSEVCPLGFNGFFLPVPHSYREKSLAEISNPEKAFKCLKVLYACQ